MRKCHATISAPTVSRMHIITNIHTHAYTCGIVLLQSTIKRARRYQYRQLLQRWQSQQQQQQRQRWRGHIHKYGETSPQNQFIRWLSNAALRTHTNRGKGKRTHSHTHTQLVQHTNVRRSIWMAHDVSYKYLCTPSCLHTYICRMWMCVYSSSVAYRAYNRTSQQLCSSFVNVNDCVFIESLTLLTDV